MPENNAAENHRAYSASARVGNAMAVLYHPLFLYFWCCLFFWLAIGGGGTVWSCQLHLIFGLTVVAPILFVRLMSRDIHLRDRRLRFWPLLFTVVCYWACWYFLRRFGCVPYLFISYYLALVALGTTLLMLITFFYKVSAHAYGLSSLFSVAVVLFDAELQQQYWGRLLPGWLPWLYLILFTIPAIIVIRQRIVSRSHTGAQVIWGSALGFGLTLLGLLRYDLISYILP